MDNVKNNLKQIWNDREVTEHRVITPNEVSSKIGIRPDTIQTWLRGGVIRLDVRVMTALARYFNCSQVVYNVKENQLTFEGNNTNE
jgi:hypothetical protein